MLVPRFKTALITAFVAAVVVFALSSIALYRHLLAHQRDLVHPVAFPPSAAFYFGRWFAVAAFALTFLICVLMWVTARLKNARKNT